MVAIQVQGVSKRFRLHRGRRYLTVKDLFVRGFMSGWRSAEGNEHWALREVSLEIPQGKTMGIIGANGSGKSTLLKLVAGILKPTSGVIRVLGRLSTLIELGAGFHPEFTGRENVWINGILLGLSRQEVRERFDEIVRFAGLEAFIDNPVKTYSSGMYMRLGFAIATAVDPDVLLIDEVLAVGDEAFQHKCIGKIQEFKARGRTICFVSHDLGAVEQLCDETLWLADGQVSAIGRTHEVIQQYRTRVAQEEATALRALHERASASQEPQMRWGGGEVTITSVVLKDSLGQERYLFESGEPLQIVLSYQVHSPVGDSVFGIGIFRKDGLSVYGTNTAIDDLVLPPLKGAGQVTVLLERVDLIEGEYLLDVAVHARDGHPYDYRSRALTFAIRSKMRDTGVARLPHRWILPL